MATISDHGKYHSFSLVVMKVPGKFPRHITSLKNGLTAVRALKNSSYQVQGWPNSVDRTTATFEKYQSVFPFSARNCLHMNGGVMFDGSNNLAGFQRLACGEKKTYYNDYYTPVVNFANSLVKAYPDIKLEVGSEIFLADKPATAKELRR
ncbi:unnamed protein product [Acanthoscelides obtectus]|uniref:Uncharacterized protein n=1 Tax=Acanthoscelides obtectus TaxID=200917 RepID=A0A9P0K9E1_ACAOB|nr:unnamed protein product [Acanthoscelides obtectus]CAK1620267.1 hypothetical protein AOBTE_LOCUS267 [Acanthoscelides obtectus]